MDRCGPVVGWACLPDVYLDILGGRRPDQLLQPDQPILILVEYRHPGPVEEHHQVLGQDKLTKNKTQIDKISSMCRRPGKSTFCDANIKGRSQK